MTLRNSKFDDIFGYVMILMLFGNEICCLLTWELSSMYTPNVLKKVQNVQLQSNMHMYNQMWNYSKDCHDQSCRNFV
jgi:hypothetical protein